MHIISMCTTSLNNLFIYLIKGDLMYVNFGTIDDFMFLNRTLNLDTSGKICIARYGRIFRGDKGQSGDFLHDSTNKNCFCRKARCFNV